MQFFAQVHANDAKVQTLFCRHHAKFNKYKYYLITDSYGRMESVEALQQANLCLLTQHFEQDYPKTALFSY
jgi:hypothetical protein